MSVFASLPLWGWPDEVLGNEKYVTAQALRAEATLLRADILEIADIVQKLTDAGWSTNVVLYSIDCYPPEGITLEQAQKQFRELGIDPEFLYEFESDEADGVESEPQPHGSNTGPCPALPSYPSTPSTSEAGPESPASQQEGRSRVDPVLLATINQTPVLRLRPCALNSLSSGHDSYSRLRGNRLKASMLPAELAQITDVLGGVTNARCRVACRWRLRGLTVERAILKARPRVEMLVEALCLMQQARRAQGAQ